jgi:mannose-1-phosphate guanylyltransferase
MKSSNSYAIIMAGGGGERFWPMSRMRTPKQLLALVSKRTLIEETVARIEPLFSRRNILVITNSQQAQKIGALLPQLPRRNIIAEPMRRDTAAAVALAATIVGERDPSATMAVLPADHVIREPERYRQVLSDCLALAQREKALVTIGIHPHEPNTGYGYIEVGARKTTGTRTNFFRARRFVEKPDLSTAKRYLASGKYRWNAGMFVWSFEAIREGLQRHMPEVTAQIARLRPWVDTARFGSALRKIYPGLPRISIDFGLMEKASNVVVADGKFAWDDVGSWVALENHLPRGTEGNVARGRLMTLRSHNNIIIGNKKLIATLGVRDLIIVQTDDATLVCHRDEAQKIKELVAALARGPRFRRHL